MKKTELLQIAKPILFNQEMVKAILDDRKTVTRRLVKPQPVCYGPNKTFDAHDGDFFLSAEKNWLRCRICGHDPEYSREGSEIVHHWEPRYSSGDILYVRETWCSAYDGEKFFYLADKHTEREERTLLDYDDVRWHPSIHMPKKAARIFLRVTDVRAERLQDINGEQAYMEGIRVDVPPILLTHEHDPMSLIPKGFEQWSKNRQEDWYQSTARAIYIAQCDLSSALINKFKAVWNSTVAPDAMDACGWAANPWVWAIEYERIEIDEENEADK